MEVARIYAIVFLGFLATLLVGHQARRTVVFLYLQWHHACRYASTHLALPKLFRGRLYFNPTRSDLLCYVLYGIAVVFFNTYGINTIAESQKMTAQLTVIHLVPLVACFQLSYIADALGLSLRVVSKIHTAVGLMATLHGLAHACMYLWKRDGFDGTVISGIVSMTAMLALAILPLARRFAYELFLYAHRACSVTIVLALWVHLSTKQSFSRLLLRVAMYVLASTSLLRYAGQTMRNVAFRNRKAHVTRLVGITESGDTAVLCLELARPCAIQPGQHIYLTLLTSRLGSLFQRHPFTIAWWEKSESERHPSIIYIVVEPRHGWTKALLKNYAGIIPSLSLEHNAHDQTTESGPTRLDFRCSQRVWIDGPFGVVPDLVHCDTVLLFASHGGVFAQLPLVKYLVEQSKINTLAIKKIVLAWEADTPHFLLKQWMQTILRDPGVRRDLLEIHIYFPRDIMDRLPHEERTGGDRVKILPRTSIDVAKYFDYEERPDLLRSSPNDIAVVGGEKLRDKVRDEVLDAGRLDLRFFELEYQPTGGLRQRAHD